MTSCSLPPELVGHLNDFLLPNMSTSSIGVRPAFFVLGLWVFASGSGTVVIEQ